MELGNDFIKMAFWAIVFYALIGLGFYHFFSFNPPWRQESISTIEITFPAEDIRCVTQDGDIKWCERFEGWRVE
jgi:hypothetical protein